MNIRCLLLTFALVFGGLAPVRAHDPGLSIAQGNLDAGILRLTAGFALADARALLPLASRGPAQWSAADVSSAQPALLRVADRLWTVHVDSTPVPVKAAAVELEAGDNIGFVLEYQLPPAAASAKVVGTRFSDLPAGHRQFITVVDANGAMLAQKLLHAGDSTLTLSLGTSAPESHEPSFGGFFRLGLGHIWTGYDHLLFLFALLIVCRTFRSVLAIVSSFTIAHSLTLALATLNVVNLPPRLVEPAIAASIVFVALENLWRRGEPSRGRLALTFAFGLIHGFGFATVLRDLGVGAAGRNIAMPLFSFNLGVEAGQMAVAAIVLPLLWQLRKHEPFARRSVPVASTLIAVAGLYWLLERVVALGA